MSHHDLTASSIERQNILNNSIAVNRIEQELKFPGFSWKDKTFFTIESVASIFQVDTRTIERAIEQNREELIQNGFCIISGKELADLKASGFPVPPRMRSLSLFHFRTLLDIAMLLTTSERAKAIRSKILDITMSVLNQVTGNNCTYINQRDPDFLDVSYQNDVGRRQFTRAINRTVDMGIYKYEYFTNRIYQCIFLEKAREYQKILRLSNRSNLRDTMYSEVLRCITSIESGAAHELEKEFLHLGRKLTKEEASHIIDNLASHPALSPFIENARNKMASRDLSFRDAEHEKLESYITSVDPEDFERFLGEKSKSLEQQIKEHRDIFLRLKDK